MKKIFILLLITFTFNYAQNMQSHFANSGELIIEKFSTAPFPHPLRANGHIYKDKLYPKEIHYSDSSVAIFIPKNFKHRKQNDFVIYFHGWWNNIDTAIIGHQLIEQFVQSNKNAILVVPEVPKNAPDSFGGKLEDSLGFKKFLDEMISNLYLKKKIKSKNIGNIILAGHSGAYRVMSFILHWGGKTKNIKEVFLFDGLYANRDKFSNWIDEFDGKFINIYTENGGTKNETNLLKDEILCLGLQLTTKNEEDITPDDLKKNKVLFIYSKMGHNDVINKKDNFMKFLQASCLKEIK